jgi:hypothetical protein
MPADRRTQPLAAAAHSGRTDALRGLALHGAVVLGGLFATVRPEGATWFGVRGPRCLVGACLGPHACPACGLARGVARALQCDPVGAAGLHPAAPPIALLALGGVALHLDLLRRGQGLPLHRRLRGAGRRCFLAAILLGWLLRLCLAG